MSDETTENQTDDKTSDENTQNEESQQTDSQQTDDADPPSEDKPTQKEDKTSDKPSLLDDVEEDELDFTTGEKPEGFPDDLWDSEKGQPDTQKMYDAMKKSEKMAEDLRKKMSKGEHKAPEKAEDYDFEVSDDLKDLIAEDDPAVAAAREVALEHGLSKEQFSGFMGEMMGKLAEIANANAELTPEQAQEYRDAEIAKLGEGGKRVIRAVNGWASNLENTGAITKEAAEELRSAMDSAERIQAFNQLRALMGGAGDIPVDGVDDGLPPDSEIADMIDKAYQSKDESKIRKAEAMLDKRRQAGRPERLQI